jgi:hypothetical protein
MSQFASIFRLYRQRRALAGFPAEIKESSMRMRVVVAGFLLGISPLFPSASNAQTSGINVTEARIGCLDSTTVNAGNLTVPVANACNGKSLCLYKAPTPDEYTRMGVHPHTKPFCTQAMEITYRCASGPAKSVTVPGDAWNQAPAQLVCDAPPASTGGGQPQNPQMVPVLQQLLQKYKGCILERYETQQDMINRGLNGNLSGLSSANGLQNRDMVTCVAGNACSLASRMATYNILQAQASRGDSTNFETNLKSAIPADCFSCQKHQEMHTKHVHCTMDCGGNNGLTQGPCFEGCKAGVDITKLVNDVVNDIHGLLQGVGLAGNQETQATGGATVSTNRIIVDPTGVAESCDSRPLGFFVAPADLLDWTATSAPQYKEALTNYEPPPPPARNEYNVQALQNPKMKLAIGANEGRLRADLREVAAEANPVASLCKAAEAFVLGNASDGNALADLSVTGRRSFAAFRARPPQESDILSCLQGKRRQAMPSAAQQNATKAALDRAYRVLGLLRTGGWPVACPDRATLAPQYIAVSGEDDQPHRPVNVPSAEFPQYDLTVSVPRPGGAAPLLVHTRYMIAHTVPPPGAEAASCASAGRTVPADRRPVLAPDAEVFLYVHGMDSRLEEAMDLTHALHALGHQRGKNYTVISMDLPTSGYADNIDYNTIAPLAADGHADGGFLGTGLGFVPNKYVVPLVDFDENFIVSFVNTLNQSVPVASHFKAVIGGSLGGNMSFRLGRPRPDAPWITTVVPWSPAGIWPSLADDGVKHAGLAVPWYFAGGDPSFVQESPGARRSFFYGGFDWQSKAAWVIPLGGGRPQAEYWYRDTWQCKPEHMRLARIDRYETYNHYFRLWHWRLGMEQVQFSQQISKPGSNPPQPLYLSNTKRMLLMCGMDDVGGGLCEDTRNVAPKMEMTPGRAIFLSTTGHSIHNERPNFLARNIIDFVDGPAAAAPPPRQRSIKVSLQSGKDGAGGNTRDWMIVTATDSVTGTPMNGSVSVRPIAAGQAASGSGQTGQKFYYTCGVRRAAKLGVEAEANYCSVVVSVPGYSMGSAKVDSGL